MKRKRKFNKFQQGWWCCLISVAENDRYFNPCFDKAITDTLKAARVSGWEIKQAIKFCNPSKDIQNCLVNYMLDNDLIEEAPDPVQLE